MTHSLRLLDKPDAAASRHCLRPGPKACLAAVAERIVPGDGRLRVAPTELAPAPNAGRHMRKARDQFDDQIQPEAGRALADPDATRNTGEHDHVQTV